MWKKGGKRSNRSGTIAIEVCFSFNFAVVIDFGIFPVAPSKEKSIGDDLTKRQNAAMRFIVFFLLFYTELPTDIALKIVLYLAETERHWN
jgi:hypothetical protein